MKIAQHDHSGSGQGANIGGGSIAADSITDANIRLRNDQYLKARNAGDTANINIIKVGTTDHLELGAPFKNNTYITARDQADSADLNVWKIDGGDNLDFGTDISRLVMKHDTYIQADNSSGTPTNLIKIDTNNDFYIDPDISKLNLKNNTFLTGRNNADSADIDIIKVDTNDKLQITGEFSTTLKIANNISFQNRNAADSAYVNTIGLDTNDEIVLGAEVVDIQTALVKRTGTAVTLTDNTSVAASAGVITLSTDEAATIEYRIVRNGDTQVGTLQFTDADTIPSEQYSGTDVGVTFSVNAGALEYTTTNTGFNASMTYTIIK